MENCLLTSLSCPLQSSGFEHSTVLALKEISFFPTVSFVKTPKLSPANFLNIRTLWVTNLKCSITIFWQKAQ